MHGRESAKWYVPLNSTRVTAGQLHDLGAQLEVPMSSSAGDLWVTIEAKLREMDHKPSNVQVALPRDPEDTSISLVDDSGVFLVVERRHEVPTTETVEPPGSREMSRTPDLASGNELIEALTLERDELQERVDALTEEKANLQTELHTLHNALESSKARVKEIWKISCEQVAEFDVLVTAKDAEIAELKSQLAARRETRGSSPSGMSSGSDAGTLPTATLPTVTIPTATRETRRGRVPPINLFSG